MTIARDHPQHGEAECVHGDGTKIGENDEARLSLT